MEKFYKITDTALIKKYEEIEDNKKKLDKVVKDTCNTFNIETKSYYLTKEVLRMDFTKNDYDKFKNKITKTGHFKKNSNIHKFFMQRAETIGRIQNLNALDFNIFIYGSYRMKVFKYENELYFYINTLDSDYNYEIKGMVEMNLSIYYDMVAKSLKKVEEEGEGDED